MGKRSSDADGVHVAGKKGNGEGSVYQRADGKWVAALRLPDGKRKVLYGKTRKEATTKLAEAQLAIKQALPVLSGRETVQAFMERWLKDVAPNRVRRTTLRRYTIDVQQHIIPALGRLRLHELTPDQVQTFVAGLSAKGLGPYGVTHARAVLRVALGEAERKGLVGRNVAKPVTVPRLVHKPVKAITTDDAKAILAAFAQTDLDTLITLALATGMRQGELLGLQWEDIDLEGGTVRLLHQLQRINRQYEIVELKTEQAKRPLHLPPIALEALRKQKRRQAEWRLLLGQAWQDLGLVFTSETGGYLSGPSITHRFHRGLAKAGIARISFHQLRHGNASLLLAQGATLRDIQYQLGHTTITLTANTYTHLAPELVRLNADRMEQALGGASSAAV